MKNDELEDILERFEYWKYVKMGGVLTNVLWEKSLDREQAIQALTSWKDKEVLAARIDEQEKAYFGWQENYEGFELWNEDRIKSLQSQGGKNE